MANKPPYVAAFDSATAMAIALGRFLHGRDFPDLGQPRYLHSIVAASDLLPRRLRTGLFARAGAREGIRPEEIERVDGGAIAAWLASLPPARPYPAVAIGSSSGALVHLCAALAIPWLPQTVLVPVRRPRPGDPDDARESLELGAPYGARLLAANPDLQLHHMHDPNQDRLMVRHMMYFRLKWRRLPHAYRTFLRQHLRPGGTIIVADCRQSWATTRVGERHLFQHGAVGGATEAEFQTGSPRVEALLGRVGSDKRRWPAPPTDGRSPEAEWGFEPALLRDLEDLARGCGLELLRLSFDEPEHLSRPTADLYRDWYRDRGLAGSSLLVESFIMLEPYLALRLGAVPFWMTFNMEPSAAWLERYLAEREPFDSIYLTLFAHGADSVGLPPIERWRDFLAKARQEGRFIGVNERSYPAHFSVFARFHDELARLPAPYAVPSPLPVDPTLEALARSPLVEIGRMSV